MNRFWVWANARGKAWPVVATYTNADGTTESYTEGVFLRRKSAEKYVGDYYQLVDEMGMTPNKHLEVGEFVSFWWFA